MSFQHQDALGRIQEVADDDASREYYLRPSDGRLKPLEVQVFPLPNPSEKACTWARKGEPQGNLSIVIKIVHWTFSSILEEGTERRQYEHGLPEAVCKWIPSCILLAALLWIPKDLEGRIRNGGYYDPVRTQDRAYPKVARNVKEDRSGAWKEQEGNTETGPSLQHGRHLVAMPDNLPTAQTDKNIDNLDGQYDGLLVRHVGPRWLCFLQDGPQGPKTTYEAHRVADWRRVHGANADISFVLVSYTREQFSVSTEADMEKWEMSAEEKTARANLTPSDRSTLTTNGIMAAREAGVAAFWLDFECIRPESGVIETTSSSPDIYRISDIVRSAHSLIIVTGPPLRTRFSGGETQSFSADNMTAWLQNWGSRIWTLPEILLCSAEHRVRIFATGDPNQPQVLAKRDLARRAVWRDTLLVRELMDHYEGTIHLTPLELVTIALNCFADRGTITFSEGDMSYALMGLLRRRPDVNKNDSKFEAFARLSMANDSDALLERLICLQNPQPAQDWFDLGDAWGAKLWDIEPRCQIAAIAEDETVVLDGAYGASIQWDKLEQVATFKRQTLLRLVGQLVLRTSTFHFAAGLGLLIAGSQSKSGTALTVVGAIIFVLSALVVLTAPILLMKIYCGKYWSTQALLFGIEGIPPNIGEIERRIFGFNHGRLRWSVAGSTLSRHMPSAQDERVGLPPVSERSRPGAGAQPTEEGFLFTLVDTYAMTATAFRAARPPTTLIVCGQEGGMQRAALCSYDYRRNAFAREQVIRVPTTILDRMFRMPRFRFALRRQRHQGAASWTGQHRSVKEPVTLTTSQKDLALIPLMFMTFALSSVGTTAAGSLSRSVVYFTVQLIVPFIISRIHLGRGIAAAILIIVIIHISYAFLNPTEGTPRGSEALAILSGAANAFLTPAYVYLTHVWYSQPSEQVLRTVIWASGPLIFDALYVQMEAFNGNKLGDIRKYLRISWVGLGILLGAYAYLALRVLGQVDWGARITGVESQVRLKTSRTWKTRSIPTPLGRFESYIFASLAFLVSVSSDNLSFGFYDGDSKYLFVYSALLPFLCVLFLAYLFACFPILRVFVFVILAVLSFQGTYQCSQNMYLTQHGNGHSWDCFTWGWVFLMRFPALSSIFVWCIPLLVSSAPFDFLPILSVVFIADGLGNLVLGVINYCRLDATNVAFPRYLAHYSISLFGLKCGVIAVWVVYQLWFWRRRGSGSTRAPGGFTSAVHESVA